jgi:hypothetical protein
MIMFVAFNATGEMLPVADATPYESVNKSEKLYTKALLKPSRIRGPLPSKDRAEFMQIDIETNQGRSQSIWPSVVHE